MAGIVNVTPDSFSDGSADFRRPGEDGAALGQWLDKALHLAAQGADILDLGGESTRPGAADIGGDEELARVSPLVRPLLDALIAPDSCGAVPAGPAFVSVDTWRAATAAAVLEAGVQIINDISGAVFDPGMAEVVGAFKPGYILGHAPARPDVMQQAPRYADVLEDVYAFFARRMEALLKAGLPEEHIALDPGIGFGKTLAHNLALLRGVRRFYSLGRPLCVGLSRKSLFKDMFGLPAGERDAATQAATALMAASGVRIHRVHDVAGAARALGLARELGWPGRAVLA